MFFSIFRRRPSSSSLPILPRTFPLQSTQCRPFFISISPSFGRHSSPTTFCLGHSSSFSNNKHFYSTTTLFPPFNRPIHSSQIRQHSSAPTSPFPPKMFFNLSEEVLDALQTGRPIVALESALITHGLQNPLNFSVAQRLEAIVREEGAIPATIALLDGQIRVGLGPEELARISVEEPNGNEEEGNNEGGRMKVSLRDIANCLVQKRIGGTTVAATMWIAHRVGIKVFGTGGIGGVHRGAEQTMDVSADLVALGQCPVAVVCAGAKSILDIGKTLEFLETQSVNVVVLDRQRNFPGFFSPRTQFLAPHCTESLEEVAQILVSSEHLGLQSGLLLACPLPPEMLAQGAGIERAIQRALADAEQKGIRGKATTPFVLKRVSELSRNESVKINICLLENNVRMAARLALEYAKIKNPPSNGPIHNFASIGQIPFPPNANTNEQQKCSTNGKKRPKIVCIGAAIVDFEVLPPLPSSRPPSPLPASIGPSAMGQYRPAQIVQRPGGVARNHADALARLMQNNGRGGAVELVTAMGKMDPGAMFLRQRAPHLNWSHTLFCPNQPTATSIGINAFDDEEEEGGTAISRGFISVDHLMAKIDAKFIDSKAELIETADFVLMDGNLTIEAIKRVQHWAERGNTKIWFEPTNALKVPKLFAAFGPNPLAKVDIFSPNLAELREFVANLGGKEQRKECAEFVGNFEAHLNSSSESLKEWLESVSHNFTSEFANLSSVICPKSHLLVTCDRRGVLVISRGNEKRSNENLLIQFLGPPEIRNDEIVSVSGAGDCFNSGFLCAQLNGHGLKESLELAKECARTSLRSAEAVPDQLGNIEM